MLSCILRFMCISPHPFILISSGSCVLACIFASSQTDTFGFMGAYWHPQILASSYSKVHMCLLEFWYPHIIISWGSCVFGCIFTSSHPYFIFLGLCMFACILAPSHPHTLRFIRDYWYACFLISSDSCVFPLILPSFHPHIPRRLGWCGPVCWLISSHPHIIIVLCPNTLAISVSYVLVGTLVSHTFTPLGSCILVCLHVSFRALLELKGLYRCLDSFFR